MTVFFVVPAMKTSGGIREVLSLAIDVATSSGNSRIISLWTTDHPMPSDIAVELMSSWRPRIWLAPLQLPVLFVRFFKLLQRKKKRLDSDVDCYVFTHYASLPLSWLVPAEKRLFFVQDLEWRFVGEGRASLLLKRVILYFYRSGRLICTNDHLTQAIEANGLRVQFRAPIWADRRFETECAEARDVDYVMMLRKGAHKRLDLYLQFMQLVRSAAGIRVAAISPDDDIVERVRDRVDICLLRPTMLEMKTLYARSNFFVHLSDHEGFGLPPLEAMGGGCLPLCRDSGGVRSYMLDDLLSRQLFARDVGVEPLFRRGQELLESPLEMAVLRRRAREVFGRGLCSAGERAAAIEAIRPDPSRA